MRLLATLLILFPSLLVGQELQTAFPSLLPVTNEVTEIKQRSFNRGFWPSGWKSLYLYEHGRLVRQINHFRGELRMDETYEYIESANSLRIKHIYTDKEDYALTFNYFNDRDELIKSELFFDQDTLSPQWLCHNFQFDSLRGVVNFEQTRYYPESRQSTECYELKFQNNRLLERLTLDSCNTVTKRESIEFRDNRTAFQIIDHMNPEVVVVGGRSEQGIQRYLYKLDKRGNWIKRYYVTANGRKILEIKRKIKYRGA